MSEELLITSEGAEKIRNELEKLKSVSRKEIAERLRSAIQMGDLSENADYHKAKEDQSFIEGRILELEYILANSTIVEGFNGKRQIVEVGARVTVVEDGDEPITYFIVGIKEADPRNGKISNESPIGKALLGHSAGDVVTVITPSGGIQFTILEIS